MQIQEEYKETIKEKILYRSHFCHEVVSADREELKRFCLDIKDYVEILNSDIIFVDIDICKTKSFSDLLFQALNSIYNDKNFDEYITLQDLSEIDESMEESKLDQMFKLVLADLDIEGIMVLLILENYDCSKNVWTSSSYGNMRDYMCENGNLSLIVSSTLPVEQVSDEPKGPSPFFNIFSEE